MERVCDEIILPAMRHFDRVVPVPSRCLLKTVACAGSAAAARALPTETGVRETACAVRPWARPRALTWREAGPQRQDGRRETAETEGTGGEDTSEGKHWWSA